MEEVAAYFQVLAEPTRLQILNLLRQREYNVGELAQACGYTAANISRHLSLMTKQGMVSREGRGTSVYYRLADDSVGCAVRPGVRQHRPAAGAGGGGQRCVSGRRFERVQRTIVMGRANTQVRPHRTMGRRWWANP